MKKIVICYTCKKISYSKSLKRMGFSPVVSKKKPLKGGLKKDEI
jgi:hypothetical protein